MDDDQQFCLRWNNHQSTLISVFDTLLENETLVDCTLAAEGKFLKAHKVVLSACSPYFATLLQEQYDKHPIFILKDVKYQELRAMMDYMYRGEVNISQDQLAALLKAAESLQIKGLSDSRGAGGGSAPKPDHHRPVPKLGGGYTLEQTKRARIGPSSMESQEMCGGSREGSSSPSRRRRKVRRRSIENALTDIHDNSNSSQIQTASTQQQQQQQQQSNVNLTGVGAITAAASAALAAATAQLPTATTTGSGSLAAPISSTATTTNANKKTETGLKGTISTTSATVSSAVGVTAAATATGSEPSTATANASADALQQVGGGGSDMEHDLDTKIVKENHHHKQKSSSSSSGGVKDQSAGELIIEPKSEYDDEGNEETVEDLTLDDEDMGMDDMDHNAGTSQGGEGSSQGYAGWPHDRSQDELLLAPPESQQRDPQGKIDKSEQTDITPEEFELDDCLLESNDIVITQNKDGFVLHVKKLGNITTAKIASGDEDQVAATAVAAATGQAHITEVQEISPDDLKPTLTTLTSSHAIKLPSSECELINIKKIMPSHTTIATHHPHASATIIHPQQIHHHHHQQQPETTIIEHHPQQQQQQHIHIQQQSSAHHAQVQSIVTTHPGGHQQTINLMGLRNVQITEQKPLISRIKYSRGKIITNQGATGVVTGGIGTTTTTTNLQIVEPHEVQTHTHTDLSDGTKYEISEIDLNNPNSSAAIISDLVKYAEIDDIELPDGTKIGIGFTPTEMTEHMQTTGPGSSAAQLTVVDDQDSQMEHIELEQHHHQLQQQQEQHHHHLHHHHEELQHHHQHEPQHHELQLHEHDPDDTTTSMDTTILQEGSITVHENPTPNITKSYTILTTRPIKQESALTSADGSTTYELSLSDSSMGQSEDQEAKYVCRHCGKKYRWKSTLRRHENVECGGKEPCHPCPHCSYKAKQRGNLGVHVRKHHPDKPQLESKRGRKF